MIVVIGFTYTQLVHFTAPNRAITQFHNKKHAMDATQPRKSKFTATSGLSSTSKGIGSGYAMKYGIMVMMP